MSILAAIWDGIRALLGGIWGRIVDEPVLTLALVQAGIALLVSFGLQWTPEQVGAFLAVTAALLGWIARSRVTPVP